MSKLPGLGLHREEYSGFICVSPTPVSCIWHASVLDLVADLEYALNSILYLSVAGVMISVLPCTLSEIMWKFIEHWVQPLKAPLKVDLSGAPETEEKVKCFSRWMSVLGCITCKLITSQEKEREGPWSGSDSEITCYCACWAEVEPWPGLTWKEQTNSCIVLWLRHAALKSNVYILFWKLNVFFTAYVCVYVFHNVNSWSPSFSFKSTFTVWKASYFCITFLKQEETFWNKTKCALRSALMNFLV